MPHQPLASKPGTNSLTVGMSGSVSERVAVLTAHRRDGSLLTRLSSL